LLYVGMTRAERYLYLTHVRKRYINGARFYMHPSPFLEEIRDELKEVAKRNFKSNSNSNNQLTIF
ncbi:MAG: hypothetical protein K9M80_05825, partial [Candidatus Marinimicrobia bacterium]|nr:hypothetical protein [Candidatus Neomarinimicrobiota bacterium]